MTNICESFVSFFFEFVVFQLLNMLVNFVFSIIINPQNKDEKAKKNYRWITDVVIKDYVYKLGL